MLWETPADESRLPSAIRKGLGSVIYKAGLWFGNPGGKIVLSAYRLPELEVAQPEAM
jgi:hypothetical protein